MNLKNYIYICSLESLGRKLQLLNRNNDFQFFYGVAAPPPYVCLILGNPYLTRRYWLKLARDNPDRLFCQPEAKLAVEGGTPSLPKAIA